MSEKQWHQLLEPSFISDSYSFSSRPLLTASSPSCHHFVFSLPWLLLNRCLIARNEVRKCFLQAIPVTQILTYLVVYYDILNHIVMHPSINIFAVLALK